MILKGGTVADVRKKRFYKADVALKNGRIEKIGKISGEAAEVIDITGKILAPGFIDAHVHIESGMVAPAEFGKAVLLQGTTAVIADPHEIVNVGGADALEAFLAMAEAAPIDIFTVVPSSVPATPFDTNGAGEFSAADMKRFIDNDKIVGLGEVMCWPDILARRPEILAKIELFRNKSIDGHTAGIPSDKIEEYAAAGIQNDHECSCFAEAKQRYDCGLNIYIREGSAARNLKDIVCNIVKQNAAALKTGEEEFDIDRLAFCTDDKHLSDIKKEGHIGFNVKLAVECGMRPVDALALATVNPARYYKLENRGVVEEGAVADLTVLSDERLSNVELVIKDGKIVAENHQPVSNELNRLKKPAFMQHSVQYRTFTPADFVMKISDENPAIGFIKQQILTKRLTLNREQAAAANILTVIERHGKNGNFSKCFLSGYGIQNGAVAVSVSHDSHNVVAAGDNPEDLAAAVNRLKEIGGGCVICSGSRILSELALDIAGLMSSASAEETEKGIAEIEKTARKLGVEDGIDPIVTLSFAALPVIPEIRLLDTGLFDVTRTEFIDTGQ